MLRPYGGEPRTGWIVCTQDPTLNTEEWACLSPACRQTGHPPLCFCIAVILSEAKNLSSLLVKHRERSFGPMRLALRSDFRTPVESIGLQKPEMTTIWFVRTCAGSPAIVGHGAERLAP
jgi:hypothetical protein